MKKHISNLAIVAASLILMSSFNVTSASALPLVTNGGFETGDFTGWTKSGSSISVTGDYVNSGNQAADLGTSGYLGSLTQSGIATVPNLVYTLSFYLSGSGGANSEFQVMVNGVTLLDLMEPSSQAYTLYTLDFTAGQSLTDIAFFERNDPGAFHLDNVSVTEAPIPEPSTLIFLGVGLLGASFLRKRVKS